MTMTNADYCRRYRQSSGYQPTSQQIRDTYVRAQLRTNPLWKPLKSLTPTERAARNKARRLAKRQREIDWINSR